MDNIKTEKIEGARPNTMRKKWLIIAIVAVVVIILAIPTVLLISINSSPYDLSFSYAKVDNPLTEIARKHTYYNATDKTIEIELNQDLINSLLKDNLASFGIQLPENVSLKELMFNTKDQRLYINAAYGKINLPISLKINVITSENGVEVNADDLKIVNTNAPGFVKNMIYQDKLQLLVANYADLGIPQVFSIKEIKYGTGSLKAVIQLIPEKISQLALDYRNSLVTELNTQATTQSGFASAFITKLLGTDVLSDAKVDSYVQQVLGNEELVNSAILFATASDLNKYANAMTSIQTTLTAWAEPLSVIKYYGNVDDTVSSILYDPNLRDMLAWFLPQGTLDAYTATVEDYYAMYLDTLGSIDEAVGNVDEIKLLDFKKDVLDFTAQAEDVMLFIKNGLIELDDATLETLVGMFEKNAETLQADLADIKTLKKDTIELLEKDYSMDLADINAATESRIQFILDVVDLLKNKEYIEAVTKIADDGVYDAATKATIERLTKDVQIKE